MKELAVKALAKINIGLDVTGVREDGYHELRSVMQTIHIFDRLEVIRKDGPGIEIHTNLPFLPTNENNLIWKAAQLLIDEFQLPSGVTVNLLKRIPVAAGLAGGSTDAAATLYGMNQVFELGLTQEQLIRRGQKVGADVPFCVMRGTALAEGIGEKLTPLSPMVKCPVIIAKPQISVSTKQCYDGLKLTEETQHPDIDRLIADIEAQDLKAIASHMGNILESVTIPENPVIETIKDRLLNAGAVGAMMTGSGPTVFALFEEDHVAEQAYEDMKSCGLAKQLFLTTIYNNRRA